MADFVFNIAKGRVVEYYNRVKNNDPINSALVLVVLRAAAIESDAVLRDKATLADVVAGTTDETTNGGYARKVLTDVDLASFTFAPDNTNDRFDVDFSDQTWSAVTGVDVWSKLLVCYNPDTTSGSDSTIIPLTSHDCSVTPDGSNIVAQVASAGFCRAT